jgi:hypothetical protein
VYIYIHTKLITESEYTMSAKAMKMPTTIWPVLCDTSQQLGYSLSSTINS